MPIKAEESILIQNTDGAGAPPQNVSFLDLEIKMMELQNIPT